MLSLAEHDHKHLNYLLWMYRPQTSAHLIFNQLRKSHGITPTEPLFAGRPRIRPSQLSLKIIRHQKYIITQEVSVLMFCQILCKGLLASRARNRVCLS